MEISDRVVLGKSKLKVSPLCLGTRMFSKDSKVGLDQANLIFDWFLSQGGNFIETDDYDIAGSSEEVLARFTKQRALRNQLIISTRYTSQKIVAPANFDGKVRKFIYKDIEGSLRRLGTEYIDLYWINVDETQTPVEEVLITVEDLIKAGKIRCFGLCGHSFQYIKHLQNVAAFRHHTSAIAAEVDCLRLQEEANFLDCASELSLTLCGADTNLFSESNDMSLILKALPSFGELSKQLGISENLLALVWLLRQGKLSSIFIQPFSLEYLEAVSLAIETDFVFNSVVDSDQVFAPNSAAQAVSGQESFAPGQGYSGVTIASGLA